MKSLAAFIAGTVTGWWLSTRWTPADDAAVRFYSSPWRCLP